jgi:hypothetical protein
MPGNKTPHDERCTEGARIAGHLCRAIAELAPADVPPGVWDSVAPSDRAFMAALKRWQDSGTEADKEALREAYRGVLVAWRTALETTHRRDETMSRRKTAKRGGGGLHCTKGTGGVS